MNNTQLPPDDAAMAAMASNVVISAMPISRKKSTRKNGQHKGDDNELMRRFEQREKKKGNVMRELEKLDQSTKRHKVNEPVKDWDDTKQKFKNIEPNKKDKVEVNAGIELPDLNHIEQQQKPQKQPDSIYVKLRSGIVINKYEKGDNVFYHDLLKSRNNKKSSEEMEANDEVDSPEENKQEIPNDVDYEEDDNQYVEPVKDISRRPKLKTNAKVSMSNEYEMNVLNQNMERSSISNDDVLSKQPADSNQKITDDDNVDINAIEDDKNEMEDTKHDEYNGSNEVDNVEDEESMIDTESKEDADDEQKILTPKVEKEEKKEVVGAADKGSNWTEFTETKEMYHGDEESQPVEDIQEEPQKRIHPWDVVLNQNQAQSKVAGSNDGDEASQPVERAHDIHPWDAVLNQINTKEREKKETKEDTQEIEAELKEPESGQEEENTECVKDTPYKPKVGERSNWTHISDDDHDEEEKAEEIDFPDDETPGCDINDIKQNHDEDMKDDDGYYSGDSHIEYDDKESMAHDMHIRYRWRRKKDNNIKDLSPRQILPRSRRGTKKERKVDAESTNDYDEDHETPADIKQYEDDDEVKFDNDDRVHFEADPQHFSAMRIAAAHADRRKILNNSSVSYPSKAAINCIPHTHFGNNYGVATTKWVKVSNEYGWIYIRDGEQEKAFRDRGYKPVPIKTPHPSHAQRRAFIQRRAQLQQQFARQYWYQSQVLYAQIAASDGPLVHNQQHRYHNTRRVQNYPRQFIQNSGYPAQYPHYRQ